MSKKIKFQTVYKQDSQGNKEYIPALMGADGSDANVTKENIDSALGADVVNKITQNENKLSELQDDIAAQPKSYSAAGKVITMDADGNINIPVADTDTYGLIKARSDWGGFGILKNNEGQLYINRISPTDNSFINKTNRYQPITPDILDDAVRLGLVSNARIADTDYPAIRQTLGIVTLTQEEYDLITPNENTIYLIMG